MSGSFERTVVSAPFDRSGGQGRSGEVSGVVDIRGGSPVRAGTFASRATSW